MFTLTMRFTLPADTDWSKIPALMQDRARNLYVNMPGLISKASVYDPDTREYGGNYLWERREQIDAFLKSDIVFRRAPEVRRAHIEGASRCGLPRSRQGLRPGGDCYGLTRLQPV